MLRVVFTWVVLVLLLNAVATVPANAAPTAGGTVVGVVSAPSDADLRDSYVSVVDLRGYSVGGSEPIRPDGSYAVTDIPPGDYRVRVNYRGTSGLLNEWGGGAYKRADAQVYSVREGSLISVDFDLERGARLTVTALEGLVPQPGASVDLVATGDTYEHQPINEIWMFNSFGVSTSRPLPPGTYRATVRGSRWLSSSFDVVVGNGPTDSSVTSLPAGGEATVDVELTTRGIVRGSVSVLTPDGPVPWTGYVHLINPENPYGGALRFTDESGAFEIDGLNDGVYYLNFNESEYHRTTSRYWPDARELEEASPIPVSLGNVAELGHIVVEQGGLLSGRVTQALGDAAERADAIVSLWKLDSSNGAYEWYSDYHTDTSGEWNARVVDAGDYAVWARPGGDSEDAGAEWYLDARYFADRMDVSVDAGSEVVLEEMVLEPRYFDVGRIAGGDRFETAVEISRFAIPEGVRAPVVYVTNGANFPDALAAGPAAIRNGGVVLTTFTDKLPAVVADRIVELDPLRVVVLGDSTAVSDSVFRQIERSVPAADMVRIGGGDRFETAELIVRDAFGSSGATTALIATGRNYPDALAAGPAAGAAGAPVILVDGEGPLTAATRRLLDDLGIVDAVVLGSTATIGLQLESDLRSLLGPQAVSRVAGGDRFETASMINDMFFANTEYALVTTGVNYADALTGGPLAGAWGSPLYLSVPTCLPVSVAAGIWEKGVVGVVLFGGTPSLAAELDELALCA